MKVSECMTRDVRIATPEETLQTAAVAMGEIDAGFLPVSENDRLIGIVTDRDIAIRGVAQGCPPDAKVRDVMSNEVKYCFEDDEVEAVLDNMGEIQVRRLPVVNKEKNLVGIVSITDLAGGQATHAGQALSDIARPSAMHAQAL